MCILSFSVDEMGVGQARLQVWGVEKKGRKRRVFPAEDMTFSKAHTEEPAWQSGNRKFCAAGVETVKETGNRINQLGERVRSPKPLWVRTRRGWAGISGSGWRGRGVMRSHWSVYRRGWASVTTVWIENYSCTKWNCQYSTVLDPQRWQLPLVQSHQNLPKRKQD